MPKIVGVDWGDEVAAGCGDATIAGRRDPRIANASQRLVDRSLGIIGWYDDRHQFHTEMSHYGTKGCGAEPGLAGF
jgi:hypothetical protein